MLGVTASLVLAQAPPAANVGVPVSPSAADTEKAPLSGIDKAQAAAAALVRGNPKEALQLYAAALQDSTLPNERRAAILIDRGITFAKLNQPKAAIDEFNRAVQLTPENAAIYNNRGNLLLSLGLAREAIKDLDRALLLSPGYAAAYNNRAQASLRLGDLAAAYADFTKAMQLMATSPAPLAGRGRTLLAQERPFAALRDFSRAIGVEQKFGPAYRGRAEAKLVLQRYDEAIEDFSRASAYDPSSVEILMLRGQAYLWSKKPDAAIVDFTKALELAPKSVSLLAVRGYAQARLEAYDEALADLAQAIEIDPRQALPFAYRAWTYKQMGQAEAGSKDVERALKLDPNLAEAHWARGELLEAAERLQEAVASFERAVAARRDFVPAVDALGRLGAKTGLEEKAEPDLGFGQWSVVSSGNRYFARNAELPRLKVPLEPVGRYVPRVTGWELQTGKHQGIGVLRFAAGQAEGRAGPEDVELAAVIDIPGAAVLALEPVRQGDRVAMWTWEEGRLIVASRDAGRDELAIRVSPVRETVDPKEVVAAGTPAPRRVAEQGPVQKSGAPSWAPWNQFPGFGGPSGGSGSKSKPGKQKTLFDMLFGF